jgi:DNA invertase Pin-like site-specific DNA recombinase
MLRILRLTLVFMRVFSNPEHFYFVCIKVQVLNLAFELERGYLLQRQAEGIAAARARGKHLGRPAIKLPTGFANIVKRWEHKEISLQKVLDECSGVCPATFYKWLAAYRASKRAKR